MHVLSSVTLSNEIFCVHFWPKIMLFFCVPTTKARWILFLNHRNRKMVGGKHNVLLHNVNACAHLTQLVLFSATLSNEIFCGSFLVQNHVVICVPTTSAKRIFFQQPHKQKSCGRQTECSSTLCEYLCTWLIWCCHLKPSQMRYFVVHLWSKILLFVCLPQQQNEFYLASTGTEKL